MTAWGRGPRKLPALVELPEGMEDPLLPLAEHDGFLPLEEVFGRAAPLDVEVGTGKGHTLVRLAASDPAADFLGIEVGTKYARLTRSRLIREGIANARLAIGEAQWILERYLAPGSVRCLHVYFPDPWPKKRHAKRRLFRDGFPPLVAARLAAGGRVRIATDHADYFEQIREVMESGGFQVDAGAGWPEAPVSSFEAKYREQGRSIHRVVYGPPAG